MITKTGSTMLKAHQLRVNDKLNKGTGVLAMHSLGSGKTLTALKAVEASPGDVLAIVPASLVTNLYKEIDKHKLNIPASKLTAMSFESAANRVHELTNRKFSLVIVDEAHRLRNTDTKRFTSLLPILEKADKRLFLSATPAYNRLDDIVPLVNLVRGDKELASGKKEFGVNYVKKERVPAPLLGRIFMGAQSSTVDRVANKRQLAKILRGAVDFHESTDEFPLKREAVVEVPMDKPQRKVYEYMTDRLNPALRYKIRKGLPLSKQETKDLNAFATGARQASNSIAPYVPAGTDGISPKIREAVRRIQEASKSPGFKALVYSNYLEAGLNPMSAELARSGIKHTMFTGAMSSKEKKRVIEEFNQNTDAPQVLMVSSSGGEGLDLRGVRKVQVLEPHFNQAKIDQVVGRAVRYRSHAHLPEDQRNVDVEYFQSVYPDTFMSRLLGKDKTIDQSLHTISRSKQGLIEAFKDVLREASGNTLKTGSDLYAHATSKENLDKILESKKILSPEQVAELSPCQEVSVETASGKSRKRADAADVLDDKPDRDKIFLTRDGYDPKYGDHVIVKKLKSVDEHDKVTEIPNEYTVTRSLPVTKSTATVYVPDKEVAELRKRFKSQAIKPLSKIPITEFTPADKAIALSDKLKDSAINVGFISMADP